eukprot:15364378-Ditylum_brightwellii.AAC.1
MDKEKPPKTVKRGREKEPCARNEIKKQSTSKKSRTIDSFSKFAVLSQNQAEVVEERTRMLLIDLKKRFNVNTPVMKEEEIKKLDTVKVGSDCIVFIKMAEAGHQLTLANETEYTTLVQLQEDLRNLERIFPCLVDFFEKALNSKAGKDWEVLSNTIIAIGVKEIIDKVTAKRSYDNMLQQGNKKAAAYERQIKSGTKSAHKKNQDSGS